jgi:hypothetical protein
MLDIRERGLVVSALSNLADEVVLLVEEILQLQVKLVDFDLFLLCFYFSGFCFLVL